MDEIEYINNDVFEELINNVSVKNNDDPYLKSIEGIKDSELIVPDMPTFKASRMPNFNNDRGTNSSKNKSEENIFGDILSKMREYEQKGKINPINLNSFSADARYSEGTKPGDNWEEQYAQNQAWHEQVGYGALKMANLTATTVAGLGGLIYGIGKAAVTQNMSSVWDNEATQALNTWNEKVDREWLPNFYTQKETDADWYNTDSWLTWNTLGDKLLKNAGYATGAIVSGNIVGGLTAAAGARLGAAAASRAAAIESAGVGTIASRFKAFTPYLDTISRGLSQGKNIEIANALETQAKTIVDVAKQSQTLKNILATRSKFTNFNDITSRGTRALFANSGEASMEALMGGNELKQKLIDNYLNTYGQEPTGEQLKNINDEVASFGKTSFFTNLALLGVTEYIQLPHLTGSTYKSAINAERQLTKNIIKEADEIVTDATGKLIEKSGKFIEVKPTTKFQKLYKGAKDLLGVLIDPKEGLQEMGQLLIEKTASDYYQKANDESRKDTLSFLDSLIESSIGTDKLGKGTGVFNSKEGIESGLLGAITGGLMQSISTVSNRNLAKTNTQKLLEKVKDSPTFGKFLEDSVNTTARGNELIKTRQQAVKEGDILEAKDAKTDSLFNYMSHKIKYGRKDLVLMDIDSKIEQSNTEEGLAQLVSIGQALPIDTKETFQQRLKEIKEFANTLDSQMTLITENYGKEKLVNDKGEEVRKYSDDALERLAYVTTKMNDYTIRINELKSELSKKNINVDSLINLSTVDGKFNPRKDIDIFVEGSKTTLLTDGERKESTKLVEDVIEMTLRQQSFLKEHNAITKNPENYVRNVTPIRTDVDKDDEKNKKVKQTISIKTKNGKTKEVEIGTEYVLGKVVRYTDKGEEVKFQPRFKVLGKNEDGTIKIEDNRGVRNVSEKEFEKYNIIPSELMKTNKKYAFLEKVQNVVFENLHIKRKDGKIQTGRLEYSDKEGSLIFAYVNEEGEIKRTTVDRKYFVAQPGFEKPMIRNKRTLRSTNSEEIAEDEAIIDFGNNEEVLTPEDKQTQASKKLEKRNEIMTELYENSVARLEAITKKLENSEKSLETQRENLTKELEKESLTKAGEKRKRLTPNMIKLIDTLSTLDETITKEIKALESEKEDIINSLPFLKQFQEDLENLPTNSYVMVNNIKEDIKNLEELEKTINSEIKSKKTLLDEIKELLNNVFVNNIKNQNPNVPLDTEELDNYLKDDGTPLNTEERKLMLSKMQELEIDISMLQDSLNIPNTNYKYDEVLNKIYNLEKNLKNIIFEKIAKQKILEKFEKIISDENTARLEKQSFESNKQFIEQVSSMQDTTLQIVSGDNETSGYEAEAKKDLKILPTSTVGTVKEQNQPLNVRTNQFLNNLHKFSAKKKNNLKVIRVTQKTEKTVGLEGLSDMFVLNPDGTVSKGKANTVIAEVVVELDEDGNTHYVNKDGERLSEEELKNPLNHVIAQVYPLEKLTKNYKKENGSESSFRQEVDSDTQESIRKQYTEWRAKELAKDSVGKPNDFEISSGFTRKTQKVGKDGKEFVDDPYAKNSIESTGFVTKDDLEEENLIAVSTGEQTIMNSISYKTLPGRVFLVIKNIVQTLNNRKLNNKESETIFESLLQLSKIAKENPVLKNNTEFLEITNWLRSVIYWGIPNTPKKQAKTPGVNNIWFEKVKDNETGEFVNRLFIASRDVYYSFTETELQNNKEAIIDRISKMYHNVDKSKLKHTSLKQQYTQIVGFEKNGKPIVKYWKNYQSYLLSEEGRKAEDIVLTTNILPEAESENGIVRDGIYMILPSSLSEFDFNPAKVEAKKTKETNTDNKFKENTTTKKTVIVDGVQYTEGVEFTYNTKYGKVTGSIIFDEVQQHYDFELIESAENTQTVNSIIETLSSVFDKIPKENHLQQVKLMSALKIIRAFELEDFEKSETTVETITEKTKEKTNQPFKVKLALGEVVVFYNESGELKLDISGANDNLQKKYIERISKIEEYKDYPLSSDDSDVETLQGIVNSNMLIKAIQTLAEQEASIKETEKQSAESKTEETEKIIETIEPSPSIIINNETTKDVKTEENKTEENPANNVLSKIKNSGRNKGRNNLNRQVINRTTDIVLENFEKVEQWIKKTLPNVPVYRVKNIIQATNGKQAWGMFHKGAIYLYENAEEGTAYHEVFEAIWAMSTTLSEKKAVIREFRNRKGTYEDAFTGKIIKYSEATIDELREQLAEEFREFVMYDKYPEAIQNKSSNLLVKIFREIVDVFKAFFLGKQSLSNTNQLFERIGSGYYQKHLPFQEKLSIVSSGIIDIDSITPDDHSTFREKIENVSATEIHQLMQSMTHSLLVDLISEGKDIFNLQIEKNGVQTYSKLKDYILGSGKEDSDGNEDFGVIGEQLRYIKYELDDNPNDEALIRELNNIASLYNTISNQWPKIINKHKEYLKSYSVKFDEATEIDYENFEKSKDEGYGNALQVDAFKNINGGLKLFLSSIQKIKIVDGEYESEYNSIGGVNLLPVGEVYSFLTKKLSNVTSLDELMIELRNIAINNPNYVAMYKRIFKTFPIDSEGKLIAIDVSKMQMQDINILLEFHKAFVKIDPEVKMLHVLSSGEIEMGDSNTSTAAHDYKASFVSGLSETVANKSNPYISLQSNGIYKGTNELLKLKELSTSDILKIIKFAKQIGIELSIEELEESKESTGIIVERLNGTIRALKDTLLNDKLKIKSLSDKTLGISNNLMVIAIKKAELNESEDSMTYFGINGERHQKHIGTNWMSSMYRTLFKVKEKKDLENTGFKYLLTDVYSQGSVLIDKLFKKNGEKRTSEFISKNFLKPVILDGTENQLTGTKKETSQLTIRERIIQNTNAIIKGIYLNLVPGDGAIESGIALHEKDDPFVNISDITSTVKAGEKEYEKIFLNYLLSELKLGRENRNIVGQDSGRKTTDLRFFKEILTKENHENLVAQNVSGNFTVEAIIENEENLKFILTDLNNYFNKAAEEDLQELIKYGIVSIIVDEKTNQEKYRVDSIDGFDSELNYEKKDVENEIKRLALNFAIANIELHKILYSDPYQYKGELKRIKSFTSPRQIIPNGSIKINKRIQELLTDVEEKMEALKPNFERTTIKGATVNDVLSQLKELGYDFYEETDGGGVITDIANRYLSIKNNTWSESMEEQFQYDMAYMKFWETDKINKDSKLTEEQKKQQIKERGLEMTSVQKTIFKKGDPENQANYTPIKPIVAGNLDIGNNFNQIVLDKLSLFPISYKMLHMVNKEANMLTVYKNMIDPITGTDYFVYASGRKIGIQNVYELYDANGKINDNPFRTKEEINNPLGNQTVLEIPLSIFGIQSEVPTKESTKTTEGSQARKLSTMDYMIGGMPIDFMSYEEDMNKRYNQWLAYNTNGSNIKYPTTSADNVTEDNIYNELMLNKELNEARIQEGLDTLLDEFGIVKNEKGDDYEIKDPTLSIKILKEGMLNREINENIHEALDGFESGELLLEAIPSYQQIRNILYSVAHKTVISQKLTGGMRVQIASTGFESGNRTVDNIPVYDKKGNAKLNKEGKPVTKKVLQSDVLKFYTNAQGQRVCEIMIPRWFKSNKSDEELLKYFNESEEGKKILKGVAYRIPTQKQNSIEVFVIKQFLPIGYRDSVIVPSALVKKVGSDFDIDKLFMYLKNIYEDTDGNIKQVPYFGIGEEAKKKFETLFYSELDKKIEKNQAELLSTEAKQVLFGKLSMNSLTKEKEKQAILKFRNLFEKNKNEDGSINAVNIEEFFINKLEYLQKNIDDLTDYDLEQDALKDFVKEKYKQSLDNAYVESFERLVENQLNFDNLVKPNSADQIVSMRDELFELKSITPINYDKVGNMMSRSFMTRYRHYLTKGKYLIGIAAQAQTGNSIAQKVNLALTEERFKKVSEKDKEFLINLDITFQNYNQLNESPSLSKIKDSTPKTKDTDGNIIDDSNYISDVIGQFIDGCVDVNKDPWIIDIGVTSQNAGTWLFLIRLGVPVQDVIYFMNQPILDKFMQELDTTDGTSLFAKTDAPKYFNKTGNKYSEESFTKLPNTKELKAMVGKTENQLTDEQLAQQLFIFQEFRKFAKMGEHLFKVTQATNFDTSTFNDPMLIFKKYMQIEEAKQSNIFDVDALLDGTFMRKLGDATLEIRKAFGKILTSENQENPNGLSMAKLTEALVLPYIQMSDSKFINITKKAILSVFDWAVQTDTTINKSVKRIMLADSNGVSTATKFIELRNQAAADVNHPLHNNYLLKKLTIDKGKKLGEVDNLLITAKDNKTYDQNQIIYAFEEIKTHLGKVENLKLYHDLVRMSILQSGLQNSKYSFANLIPFKDFIVGYNATLSKLGTFPNLQEYYNSNMFQRTNWNDSQIVPKIKDDIRVVNNGYYTTYVSNNRVLKKQYIEKIESGEIPMLIKLKGYQANSDVVSFSWTDETITSEERAEMKASKDYDYIKNGLFQKVYKYNEETEQYEPLIDVEFVTKNGITKEYKTYIYKQINAYGDSQYAKEYYNSLDGNGEILPPSVINNGYQKVQKQTGVNNYGQPVYITAEVEDNVIEEIYNTTEKIENIESEIIENINEQDITEKELESSETFKEKEIDNAKELIRPKTISLSEWKLYTLEEQIEKIEQDKKC